MKVKGQASSERRLHAVWRSASDLLGRMKRPVQPRTGASCAAFSTTDVNGPVTCLRSIFEREDAVLSREWNHLEGANFLKISPKPLGAHKTFHVHPTGFSWSLSRTERWMAALKMRPVQLSSTRKISLQPHTLGSGDLKEEAWHNHFSSVQNRGTYARVA